LIYTSIIEVDLVTLFSMIAASVLGAWLGAGVVARWPRRNVQIGMGAALLVAAALMLMTQLNLFPAGGATLGVRGVRLAIGIGGNFVLGALMTLGIGLYAPCMILVSLLGMNPKAAFPIMMGSCAFLMPVGSLRFIREQSYSLRAALGLAVGGIPGVLLAAYIIKELPLYAVRWLVIVVVVYTALRCWSQPRPSASARRRLTRRRLMSRVSFSKGDVIHERHHDSPRNPGRRAGRRFAVVEEPLVVCPVEAVSGHAVERDVLADGLCDRPQAVLRSGDERQFLAAEDRDQCEGHHSIRDREVQADLAADQQQRAPGRHLLPPGTPRPDTAGTH
jgi:uncharacterized membrane protein YfcA